MGKIMLPVGSSGNDPACQCRRHKRRGFDPWVGKIPWRRAWQPTIVFLHGESHGQRRLAGYSPQGYEEEDVIKHSPHAPTKDVWMCMRLRDAALSMATALTPR